MVSNKRFCGQCGVGVPVDDRFCGSCGHKLGQQAASSSSERVPTSPTETLTNDSRSPVQRFLEQETAEASTNEPSEKIIRKATCPHCDGTGTEKQGDRSLCLREENNYIDDWRIPQNKDWSLFDLFSHLNNKSS